MAKKVLKELLKVVIIVLVYVLQLYVINNTTFFGIVGNLPLVLVALIVLTETNTKAYVIATICGMLSDMLFPETVCKYLVIYIFTVTLLIGMKKLYKQDSKLAIIIFSALATCIFEAFMVIFNVVTKLEFVNIFAFLFLVLKESILNVFFAFILYLMLRVCSKEG